VKEGGAPCGKTMGRWRPGLSHGIRTPSPGSPQVPRGSGSCLATIPSPIA
jgi:hypothetical protein